MSISMALYISDVKRCVLTINARCTNVVLLMYVLVQAYIESTVQAATNKYILMGGVSSTHICDKAMMETVVSMAFVPCVDDGGKKLSLRRSKGSYAPALEGYRLRFSSLEDECCTLHSLSVLFIQLEMSTNNR